MEDAVFGWFDHKIFIGLLDTRKRLGALKRKLPENVKLPGAFQADFAESLNGTENFAIEK